MNTTLPPYDLHVKTIPAVECGTLALLLDAVHELIHVMALERVVTRSPLTVYQWAIHLTARNATSESPVYFATLPAAEMVGRATAITMTMPLQRVSGEQALRLAQHAQRQLLDLVLAEVSGTHPVVVPSRYRLPDEWVWAARCQEPRLQFVDGSWTFLQER